MYFKGDESHCENKSSDSAFFTADPHIWAACRFSSTITFRTYRGWIARRYWWSGLTVLSCCSRWLIITVVSVKFSEAISLRGRISQNWVQVTSCGGAFFEVGHLFLYEVLIDSSTRWRRRSLNAFFKHSGCRSVYKLWIMPSDLIYSLQLPAVGWSYGTCSCSWKRCISTCDPFGVFPIRQHSEILSVNSRGLDFPAVVANDDGLSLWQFT